MNSKSLFLLIIFALVQSNSSCQNNASFGANNTPIYGTTNCGLGFGALNNNPNSAGGAQTATGLLALHNDTAGSLNTAFGAEALYNNFDGYSNTAFGFRALYSNSSVGIQGNNNTSIGYRTLYTNSSGSYNIGVGSESLFFNTLGGNNTAIGEKALNKNSSNASSNYGFANTACGYKSLYSNLSGDINVAIGYNSMFLNEHGIHNCAAGFESLFTTGTYGTNNGDFNIAIGYRALYFNQEADNNVAIGYRALFENTTGLYNLAIGTDALQENTSGDHNVGIGVSAGNKTQSGLANVSIGHHALYLNTNTDGNTAVGTFALAGNTGNSNAEYNTALGFHSLNYNTSGLRCTSLGALADVSALSFDNATSIGYGAIATANNSIRLGNASIIKIECVLGIIQPSDGRFKLNVSTDDVKGLEFIMDLNPVVYNFDSKRLTEHQCKNMDESMRKMYLYQDFNTPSQIRQSGFIAQEVALAAKKSNYEFNGVVGPKSETDNFGLNYALFVVPLVKAIQQQQASLIKNLNNLQFLSDTNLDSLINHNPQRRITFSEPNTATLKGISNVDNFTMEAQPNPFKDGTSIKYSLPIGISKADLLITDLTGKKLFEYELDLSAKSEYFISGLNMEAGIYLYSILGNGIVLGTKRMIVIK